MGGPEEFVGKRPLLAPQKPLLSLEETLNVTEGNFHQLVALLHCRGLHKVNPFPLPISSPTGSLCLDPQNYLLLLLGPLPLRLRISLDPLFR